MYLAIKKKFNIISCDDEHGPMLLYDKMVILTQTIMLTNVGAEFIIALFNDNTQETLYLIAIYKPPKMQVNYFCCILTTIMKQMPQNVPMIIIEDFNVDILIEPCQSTILRNFMNTQKFKVLFSRYTTIDKTQMNHIWTNAPRQQCHSRSTQAYLSDHKLVYIVFKLPNYVPCFITPTK